MKTVMKLPQLLVMCFALCVIPTSVALAASQSNTAVGYEALFSNTTANFNVAVGYLALPNNTTGPAAVAIGPGALFTNTTGPNNVAVGNQALYNNSTGGYNIAVGDFAGANLTTGDRNIHIGNEGVAGEAFTIRIGGAIPPFGPQTRTFIAGIRGITTTNADAIAVVIDSAGQLGTISSSKRFKEEIKPMDRSSEAILRLKPVTFHYKNDATGRPQFGLIAEEVAAVDPGLVVLDEHGEIYTVRYEAVNAMLLNEFLKEHCTVQDLKSIVAKQAATIAQQQKDFQSTAARQQEEIQTLTAGLKEQASQIKKVSAQIEVTKPAPQVVDTNQ